jgi:hypothetical protein
MEGVGFGKILNAKIINTKDERDGWLGAMAPETWSERCWFVELLNELVKSDDGGFLETIHASTNFEVNKTVWGDLDIVSCVVSQTSCGMTWVGTRIY